jgi:hypothetical protein
LAESGALGGLAFLFIGVVWVRIIWKAHPWRSFHRASPSPEMVTNRSVCDGRDWAACLRHDREFLRGTERVLLWIMAAMAAGPILKRPS